MIGNVVSGTKVLIPVTEDPLVGLDARRIKEIMTRNVDSPPIHVDVTTRGMLPFAAEYARDKVGGLGKFSRRPVLHAHVRLTRHRDRAVWRPVVAQANLDVQGRPVRAQAEGVTAREAIDRLAARLRHQLERVAEHWDVTRGTIRPTGSYSWQHGSRLTRRPNHCPRPADERDLIRRKSFAMMPCTVDEAALEMDLLDYDFHLFNEKGSGIASVLYRSDPTGYRLAQVAPTPPDELSPHELPLTISPHPAPCITIEEAQERLDVLGLPFLFFIDAAQGRAAVLYIRYDGNYGLISPAC